MIHTSRSLPNGRGSAGPDRLVLDRVPPPVAPRGALAPLVVRTLAGARVVFVFNSFELGGAERQAIHLAAFLKDKAGCEVEVWGFSPPGPAAALCEAKGLAHRSLEYPLGGRGFAKAVGMARFLGVLRRARPTIVLPYTMAQNIICGLTWRWGGAEVCVWNQRDEGRARASGWIEGAALRRTPVFISNSRHAGDFLIEKLHARAERVHVVANGVEAPVAKVSRQTWRQSHHLSENTFVACMMANLHRYKDHATLLRAWRIVRDKLAANNRAEGGTKPGPKVLLAGRLDDTADELEKLAAELHLLDTVEFLGPVADVGSLLGAIDLCVFSSRCEGCPNAVLESMAAGLPVVATDILGIREALGPDGAEALSPPADAAAMADQILRMILDPELRQRHAARNRQRVAMHFSLDRMCQQSSALLADALAAARAQ